MSLSRANVWTVAPGSPFLRTLVQGCMEGTLGFSFSADQRDFSQTTIYVPTRRAARALAHAFAEALQPRAVLLPRIIPLGDPADLEERAILAPENIGLDDDLPPAVGDLDRRLVLATLVETWRTSGAMRSLEAAGDGFTLGGGFADSFSLAGDLASLIDEFTVESIDWRRLKELPHGDFDQYWSITRSFLEIAGTAWPEHLKERGLIDPAERLNRLLRNEAKRMRADPPVHPVIAAGSTGTVPATAELLATIARLPKGAVILPGLDLTTDKRGWGLVADGPDTALRHKNAQPGHPQAALKRLLQHLRIARNDVGALGSPASSLVVRSNIIHASARAAEATDDWPDLRNFMQASMSEGLKDICIIDAADEREEAIAIAIALREVLEPDDANAKEKTAALVTPDRALAQRVAIELKRWGIVADDSSGTALSQMPLGGFARLVLSCLRQEFNPTSVMALLSHSCLAATLLADLPEPHTIPDTRAALELAGFRGHASTTSLAALSSVLDGAEDRIKDRHAPPPLARITEAGLASARQLVNRLVDAIGPLDAMSRAGPHRARHNLADFADAHETAFMALAGERGLAGADALALGRVMDSLRTTRTNPPLTFDDYAGLFETLLAETIVAPSQPVQGRIKIWGLLEARLMEADRVVLGGLNEKTWPPDVRTDPFLNRSMRAQLGLSTPERRIGQTAHDFAQALGAPEVVIARAISVEGTPMIASRFLRRLDAFVGEAAAKAMRGRGQVYCHAARALDLAKPTSALRRPEPSPPAFMQPVKLSVTEISTLYRDPYAIYAKHILNLHPLEPLEQAVDAREKGTIIHEVLAEFIEETSQEWPEEPLERLLAIGRVSFAGVTHLEKVSAFWWPVFERVAAWFVDWEKERRTTVRTSHVEKNGELTLALADGKTFTLKGRADRIDLLDNGGLAILDYKTGATASAEEVGFNNEPQLTLMAEMARRGCFNDIPATPVHEIGYVSVGSSPGYKAIDLLKKHGPIEEVAAKHIASLRHFLNRLRSGEERFVPRRKPRKQRDGGDYDYLARTKEWLGTSDETE